MWGDGSHSQTHDWQNGTTQFGMVSCCLPSSLAAAEGERCPGLPSRHAVSKLPAMFVVDEETAAAIRRAWEEGGELAGVVELRRHFPLITDTAQARLCVRTVVGWKPAPPPARTSNTAEANPERPKRSRALRPGCARPRRG
jgi:hypothetical protein